jgi:hypothetical protein
MVLKRRLGDRREYLRFEVAGQLWCGLDRSERVVLRNIASGGALVEAGLTSGLKSMRAAQLRLEKDGPRLDVVVRHIEPLAEDGDRYLVGLEFVNLSPATRAEVDRFVHDWTARAAT